MISIINVKSLAPNKPGVTYVGRSYAGWEGSVLGNPFHIGKDGSREVVIQKYLEWLRREYQKGGEVRQEINRLAGIHMMGGKVVLGCWCSPQACHAEMIKTAVEKVAEQNAAALNKAQK